jgi:hypothetical protein
MRFLKTLTLNRRAIYDSRVVLNTDNTFTVADSTAMVVPKSESSLAAVQTNGMIRYNTDTNQFEGRQNSVWREFRFKEPTKLIVQPLGVGDDFEKTFGPLNPDPYDPAITIESGTTWDAEQMAQNLLVINETVWQIGGISYDFTVVQNPSYMHPAGTLNAGDPYAAGTYIKFTVAIAAGRPVYVIHNAGR